MNHRPGGRDIGVYLVLVMGGSTIVALILLHSATANPVTRAALLRDVIAPSAAQILGEGGVLPAVGMSTMALDLSGVPR